MNQDQVAGRWEQLKGRARRAWGELTDDDFLKAQGSKEKLHGIIREKVGDTDVAIKAKLEGDDKKAGKLKKAKGRVKKALGELTSDHSLKREGTKDKIEGAIQEKIGDAKEAIKSKL